MDNAVEGIRVHVCETVLLLALDACQPGVSVRLEVVIVRAIEAVSFRELVELICELVIFRVTFAIPFHGIDELARQFDHTDDMDTARFITAENIGQTVHRIAVLVKGERLVKPDIVFAYARVNTGVRHVEVVAAITGIGERLAHELHITAYLVELERYAELRVVIVVMPFLRLVAAVFHIECFPLVRVDRVLVCVFHRVASHC